MSNLKLVQTWKGFCGAMIVVLSSHLVSCSMFRSNPSSKVLDSGVASWYGKRFHGKQTASGERYNMHDFTAAHRTLPFGTTVLVKSLTTGQTVQVRINDRGPFIPGRMIDLSFAAAQKLGFVDKGEEKVELYQLP